jgi:hypothetical protein
VAKAKLPVAIAHINESCSPSNPLVVFAWHKEIVDGIVDGCAKLTPLKVYGPTPLPKRHDNVAAFQRGDSNLIVGSYDPMGTGWTLTRSCQVVIVEMVWTPGGLCQAEDRLWRMTQKNAVLVQHLVLEGSLDAVMAKRVIEKQKVIDAVLNVRVDAPMPEEAEEPVLDTGEREVAKPATESTTRQKIAAMALKLTADDIRFIHASLRLLAGLDGDWARAKNDIGFNRIDSEIGHDLASKPYLTPRQAALSLKIAYKYRSQLGPDAETKMKEMMQ